MNGRRRFALLVAALFASVLTYRLLMILLPPTEMAMVYEHLAVSILAGAFVGFALYTVAPNS